METNSHSTHIHGTTIHTCCLLSHQLVSVSLTTWRRTLLTLTTLLQPICSMVWWTSLKSSSQNTKTLSSGLVENHMLVSIFQTLLHWSINITLDRINQLTWKEYWWEMERWTSLMILWRKVQLTITLKESLWILILFIIGRHHVRLMKLQLDVSTSCRDSKTTLSKSTHTPFTIIAIPQSTVKKDFLKLKHLYYENHWWEWKEETQLNSMGELLAFTSMESITTSIYMMWITRPNGKEWTGMVHA